MGPGGSCSGISSRQPTGLPKNLCHKRFRSALTNHWVGKVANHQERLYRVPVRNLGVGPISVIAKTFGHCPALAGAYINQPYQARSAEGLPTTSSTPHFRETPRRESIPCSIRRHSRGSKRHLFLHRVSLIGARLSPVRCYQSVSAIQPRSLVFTYT